MTAPAASPIRRRATTRRPTPTPDAAGRSVDHQDRRRDDRRCPAARVTYTIIASNAGPSSVTGATRDRHLPGIAHRHQLDLRRRRRRQRARRQGPATSTTPSTCRPAASVTYTVTATLSATATGTLSNTATVTAPGGVTDPTPGNNIGHRHRHADAAGRSVDHQDRRRHDSSPGIRRDLHDRRHNAGPSSATGATVTDTFPASLTGISWTCVGAGGGTCTASGAGNINDAVNLPVGGIGHLHRDSRAVSPQRPARCRTPRRSRLRPASPTRTPGNNSATDTDTLTPQADLSITKTDGVTTAVPGTSVTYTIVASNAGPSDGHRRDGGRHLPGRADRRDWTCVGAGGGTCPASGAGNINDSVNLPVGGTVTYTVTAARSSPAATGTLVQHRHRRGAWRRHRSDPGQQLGDRHRHADAAGRPVDHQDRRRDDRDARQLGDLHDRRLERRPERRSPARPSPTPSRRR